MKNDSMNVYETQLFATVNAFINVVKMKINKIYNP